MSDQPKKPRQSEPIDKQASATENATSPGTSEPADLEKSAQTEVSPDTPPIPSRRRIWRLSLLLILITIFFGVLYFVRETLLPFILAVVIAYILSPAVEWISQKKIGKWQIRRWVAVIMIYLLGFIIIYTFSLFVMPRFYNEFLKLGRDVPTFFRKASVEWIPSLNEKVQNFIATSTRPIEEEKTEKEETGEKDAPRPLVAGPEDPDEIILMEPTNGAAIEKELKSRELEAMAMDEGDIADEAIPPSDMDRLITLLENMSIDVEQHGEHRYRLKVTAPDKLNGKEETDSLQVGLAVEQYLYSLLSSGQRFAGDAITLGRTIVTKIFGSLMTMVLTLMIAAFILMDTPKVMRFFRSLVPPKYREEYDGILTGIDKGLGGVIRGQLTICMVNGVLTGVGLGILGVKYAVFLAMMAAVFSLIPIFGTIISTIPAVGIALTQSLTLALLALIWIIIIHQIEANLLNPKIMGTAARIHPVLVVLALVAGEYAFGLFGALLAVPVFSIFQTLFIYFRAQAYPE